MKRFEDRSIQISWGCKYKWAFGGMKVCRGRVHLCLLKNATCRPNHSLLLIAAIAILHTSELCLVYREIVIAG